MAERPAGYGIVPDKVVWTMTEMPIPDDTADDDREERIRRRAYEISQQEDAGTPEDNWQRAERELVDLEGGDSLALDG
jgi:hypothetical protein